MPSFHSMLKALALFGALVMCFRAADLIAQTNESDSPSPIERLKQALEECQTPPEPRRFTSTNNTLRRTLGSPEEWNEEHIQDFKALTHRWVRGGFYQKGDLPMRCPGHHRMVDLLLLTGDFEKQLGKAWDQALRNPEDPWHHHLLSLLTSREHHHERLRGWMHQERLSRWPTHLRLSREGNDITGAYSFDGENWHVVQRGKLKGLLQFEELWVGWFVGTKGPGNFSHQAREVRLNGEILDLQNTFIFPIGEKAQPVSSGNLELSLRSDTEFPYEKSKVFQGLRVAGDFDFILELGETDFPPYRRNLAGLSLRFGQARVTPSINLTLQTFHRLSFVQKPEHNNEGYSHLQRAARKGEPHDYLKYFSGIRLGHTLHIHSTDEISTPEIVRLTQRALREEDSFIFPFLSDFIRNAVSSGETSRPLDGQALVIEEMLSLSSKTWHHFLEQEGRILERIIPIAIANLKATDHRATGFALEKRWEAIQANR
ncbi:MAG: hypothetical protein JJT75_08550 [Opitutales bacterium]|nr:hypothetical protein [Opitutales bacterium]